MARNWCSTAGGLCLYVAGQFTDGDQYSIVYLTPKGWLDIIPDVKRQLVGIGMPVSDSTKADHRAAIP